MRCQAVATNLNLLGEYNLYAAKLLSLRLSFFFQPGCCQAVHQFGECEIKIFSFWEWRVTDRQTFI
jgi:hypothetical protein